MLKTSTFVSILTAVVFCPVAFGMAATENKPNPRVDYVAKLNELGRAGRDESLNAASYYEKAFELCVEQPEQLSSSDIASWPEDLPKDKQILLQNWVSANSEALEQLKLGTQKSYYWTDYQRNFMFGTLSSYDAGKMKTLVGALCLRAELNAVKGDFEASFSGLLECYKFGTHFTGPKTLIDQLIGISISASAVHTAFQVLDKNKKGPALDLLEEFQLQFEALSSEQNWIIDFTFEKFSIYDLIQKVFTDDSKDGGRIPKERVEYVINLLMGPGDLSPEKYQERTRKWEKLERKKTTELTDKFFKYFSLVAHKTPAQLHIEGKNPQDVAKEIVEANPMLNVFPPSYLRVHEISYCNRVDTDALVTALGLLRYKADKGEYPDTLQRLVTAGYLRKLPMDPYSDKPLVYKRTKDNFILYSVGADFDDDGGVHSKWGKGKEGGDQVFWPVSEGTAG